MKNTPIERNVIDETINEFQIVDFSKATIREVKAIASKAEATSGVEFIKMEMGVPGLPASAVGVKAEIEALQNGIASLYPDINGLPELKKEASNFIKAFINVDLSPEGCVPVTGSMQGTFASFLTCSQCDEKKDTILFIDPGFPVQKQQLVVMGQKYETFDVYDYRGDKLKEKLESYLEKGQDDYEVMALIQKGRMQAESGGKIEQVFVANGLLCWMYLIRQDLEEALHVMQTFRERCKKEAPKLIANIDTFLCRLHLYRGDTAEILAWLESAPDENREFYILERFRYVTKVRVYLQQGKYEAAYNLLQQLLYYAKEMERTYIRIESTLLLAVTCYKMDRKEWKNLLQEAVSEAESYHFVRILTKEAGLWLPLLKKSREEIHWTDPHFHRQVLEEGKRMAQMYPGYLRTKAEGEVTLSDTARKILRMQAEGDSMNKIAGQLGLAEVTVKYHCRETYRKLGVNGKAAAVNEARKRKLI